MGALATTRLPLVPITNAQCSRFHFLCLPRGFVKARLEIRPAMLPINLDGLFPGVCQDDELRPPVVVMGAKAHDVNLSHSGRKMGKKPGQSKGEVLLKNRNARLPGGHFFILRLGQNPVMCRSHDPPRDRAKDGRVSAGIPRHSRPGNP